MFTLVLLTALAPAAPEPAPSGLSPEQGVAVIDAKGKLRLTCPSTVPAYPQGIDGWRNPVGPDQERTVIVKRGEEKVPVKVKITTVTLTTLELPANAVEAFTVDGKRVAPEKLATLLEKERIVLIAVDGKKVDPFLLELYKEGTIVLVPPPGRWTSATPSPSPRMVPRLFPSRSACLNRKFRRPIRSPSRGAEAYPPRITFREIPMNTTSKWLALPAAWLAAASLSAAPIPTRTPSSQGPISDALSARGLVPMTRPPSVQKVVMPDDASLEVHHRFFQPVEVEEVVNQTEYRQETREAIVKRDGKDVKVLQVVTIPIFRQVVVKKVTMVPSDKVRKELVPVKSCKFFTVTSDGKLEAIEVKQAAERLKKPTAVLIGDSPVVEPRHLELVKAGTLYVVRPAPSPVQPAPPMPRDEKRED